MSLGPLALLRVTIKPLSGFCLFLCALLAGCQNAMHPVTYVSPEAGPRAKIRFVAPVGPTQVKYFQNLDSCKSELVAVLGTSVVAERGWGRTVGIPLGESFDKRAMTEVSIPAGRPFSAIFDHSAI